MRHTATMFARGETTCFKIEDQFAESVIDVFYNEIKLPDAEQCEATAQHFYRERGMPGCIGAMDGKHFHITAGGGDDVSFKCYKGYRSLTVLGLCDHNYKFTWISDFWPGKLLFLSRDESCQPAGYYNLTRFFLLNLTFTRLSQRWAAVEQLSPQSTHG